MFFARKPRQRRRLAQRQVPAEVLEDRALLAGNVLVSFSAADIALSGDAQDNQLVIAEPVAGTVRITGVSGTTINGRASVDLTGRLDDVRIRLRQGGEDQVAILGALRVPGNFAVQMGDGSFLLDGSSGQVRIGKELKVTSGRSGDVTIRNDVRVAGKTTINAGGTVNVVAGQAELLDYTKATFSDSLTIDNPYFPLEVGTIYTYEAATFDAAGDEVVNETIVVEVLPETKIIEGIETRVVVDRVYRGGLLVEETLDWYAQDDQGIVWYFGEDVTNFTYDSDGNPLGSNKGGSWTTGVNAGQAGIIMQADPRVGNNYYQEFSPSVVTSARGTVLDQAKVLATDDIANVPAGSFSNVLRTEDTTAVEPDHLANKLYAPGLGSVQEFDFDLLTGEVVKILRLVSAELNGETVTEIVPPDGFVGVNVTGRETKEIRFKGDVNIQSRDTVIIRGAEFQGSTTIRSQTDVAVIESFLDNRVSLRAEGAVNLRNVEAEDRLQISGDADVYIFDSEFLDEVSLRLGRSANTVVVAGSAFHKFNADGGSRNDLFQDAGDNAFGTLKLRRFERT